jgi:hypothetical protein
MPVPVDAAEQRFAPRHAHLLRLEQREPDQRRAGIAAAVTAMAEAHLERRALRRDLDGAAEATSSVTLAHALFSWNDCIHGRGRQHALRQPVQIVERVIAPAPSASTPRPAPRCKGTF